MILRENSQQLKNILYAAWGVTKVDAAWKSALDSVDQAGETLESLKHKKSDFIVRAVCEYLERHPDIETGAVVRIEVRRELFRRDELEKIVRSMIQQYVSNAGQQAPPAEVQTRQTPAVPQQAVDSAVSRMLDNLDEFL